MERVVAMERGEWWTTGGREGTILSFLACLRSERGREALWEMRRSSAAFEEESESGGSWTGYCNISGAVARDRRREPVAGKDHWCTLFFELGNDRSRSQDETERGEGCSDSVTSEARLECDMHADMLSSGGRTTLGSGWVFSWKDERGRDAPGRLRALFKPGGRGR